MPATITLPRRYAVALDLWMPTHPLRVPTHPGCARCLAESNNAKPCPSCAAVLREVNKPIRTLTCCVCGESTKGRQWYNRDHGHGLCPTCGDFLIQRNRADESAEDMAGVRGIHWDVEVQS
jgi:hypothetical protein